MFPIASASGNSNLSSLFFFLISHGIRDAEQCKTKYGLQKQHTFTFQGDTNINVIVMLLVKGAYWAHTMLEPVIQVKKQVRCYSVFQVVLKKPLRVVQLHP